MGQRWQIGLGSRSWKVVAMMDQKAKALTDAADQLGWHDQLAGQVLSALWDSAFQQGQLEALDELQDRFCVCMK